jgi:imidazolonepropionase-like amidohydrolase
MTITAIRADALFDGERSTAQPTVIIDGGTITAVGVGLTVPDTATIVDLSGSTLVPGFVDGHVHTVFDASADPVAALAQRDDAAVFAAMTGFARTAAAGGVTTMRDLGDRGFLSIGLRAAAAADPTLPTMLAAGPPITSPGGHCHFLGVGVCGVDGVRAAVRERVERGVDVIKIMASGGNMTPGSHPHLPQFGPDELTAAVDEAHRHGLPITAHAHSTQAIVDALAAGVDGFEHLSFMTEDGVDPVPPAVIDGLVARGVTVGVTFGMRPVEGRAMPSPLATRLPALMGNVRKLAEAGVYMIAGTDAGIGPMKPPDVIRWAVGSFVQVGYSHAQALHACTARAAVALGLGRRKGRIAPGYDADIVAVAGDPLADLDALHRIRAVFMRGVRLAT